MLRRATIISALLLACACGKSKALPGSRPPVAAVGLDAMPADAHVLIGLDMARLRGSPLVKGYVAKILAADAEAKGKLDKLLERCQLDPARDLESVWIGMGAASEVALIAKGKLDEVTLVGCVRQGLADEGGSLATSLQDGRTIYATQNPRSDKLWFSFPGGGTVVVSSNEAWLHQVLDPAAAKATGKKETEALLKTLAPEAAVWGVGFLPPEAGERIKAMTQGAVAQPATAITAELRLDAGLAVTLKVTMQSDGDAQGLAGYARSQMPWLQIAAGRFGLGEVAGKTQISQDGSVVKLSVQLGEADLQKLESVFH